MLLVLSAVLPVFALIAAGAAFGRLRGVSADGIAVLNGFTVYMALPALLFRSLAEGDWAKLDQPGFVLAFMVGMVATFAIGFALRPPAESREPLGDRSLVGLTAAYANTAFIGIPLAGSLLGETGVTAAVIASILTVSILFACSLLLVEIGRAGDHGLARSTAKVLGGLARNPLILSPIAGAIWALTGLPLPGIAARSIDLLAAAASPCALVTIGAFLALPRRTGPTAMLAPVLLLKLVVQPAITAIAAYGLLPLLRLSMDARWAAAAILIAALPTGTGPFMLAELYGREATLASRGILLTTVIGIATIAILAFLIMP